MRRFFGIAIALVVVLNSIVFSDICNHDPFPPFPPSPPEFQTPVAVQQQGDSAILSWAPVSSDGYSVLICESGQFIPVAHDVKDTNLVLSDFNAVGQQEFLVMAYVKVADNLVYNSGAVGAANFIAVSSEIKEGLPQVNVALASDVDSVKVSMQDRNAVLSSLPKFNGSHSFYSAKYPEVKNPFHPTTLPTGEIVPALLLDQDIDATVERLMKNKKPSINKVSNAINPGVKPASGSPEVALVQGGDIQSSTVSKVRQAQPQGPDVESQDNKTASSVVNTADDADTKDKKENNSSNVMIIIVVVILIIFFQLFKEGK
ncbi:MAG: hypothetical protein KC646_10940 [Candidatus Cloacimonetes bacterium]|nr:hypothetical protein [Candidatus Cloacimonadota bacterium]